MSKPAACPVGVPMLVRSADGWHVLGEDGQKFELVLVPDKLDPDAEAPGNDELRFIGAFDRKTKVGRHQAENRHHLRATIEALDAARFSDAADTLVWQVWHQVNGVARAREFHRLALARCAEIKRDYHLLCQEERRLRRLLEDGPTSPQECAEFCKSAREDGDGKPCLDCDQERFTL